MAVVLITADIFHLGVFKGPPAPVYPKSFDQEGDRDGLFLILQPFIFTGTTPLGQVPPVRLAVAPIIIGVAASPSLGPAAEK